jgi:hypothetical protein
MAMHCEPDPSLEQAGSSHSPRPLNQRKQSFVVTG